MDDDYTATPEEIEQGNAISGLMLHQEKFQSMMFDLLDGTYYRWQQYYKKQNDKPDDTDIIWLVQFLNTRVGQFYEETENADYATLNHDQKLLQQAEITTKYLATRLTEQLER